LLIGALLQFFVFTDTWALGPVDGEIIVSLWNNRFSTDVLDGEVDAGHF